MTYSQSITGVSANSLFAATTLTLADANAATGAQLNSMQNGTVFLCKGPDGGQQLYRLDAERSTPSKPVLIPMSP